MEWNHFAHDGDQWRAVVKVVMKPASMKG